MNLEDIVILSSMGLPGGGRSEITPRIMRHFYLLAYPEMEDEIIFHIFSFIMKYFLV